MSAAVGGPQAIHREAVDKHDHQQQRVIGSVSFGIACSFAISG